MADVTWHSLGVSEGFLSAMGFVKQIIYTQILNTWRNVNFLFI